MGNKNKQDRLEQVDELLAEIREELTFDHTQGDLYELRALQLLLQVTKTLHSEHDIYALLTLILDSAISFAEASRAFLMLMDENETLQFRMGRSRDGDYLTEADFAYSTSVVQDALAKSEPTILSDAQNHVIYSAKESIQSLNLRTIMAAPLRYQEQVIGLIYIDSKRPLTRYSKHHLSVLTSLADQAAVSIANRRDFETLSG
jgi:GAF domain-containing protein